MRPKISFSFCAMICLMAWLDLHFCLWFLLGSLVHELGHLLVMKLCRVPIRGMQVGAKGAVLEVGLLDYKKELLCAAAGPAASILLGVGLLRLAPRPALVSFLLAAVNLLPLYPLDGGRMALAGLLLRHEPERAEKIMHTITFVTCCILMFLACWGTICLRAGLWPIFAAFILLWRAGDREKQLQFSASKDKIEKK